MEEEHGPVDIKHLRFWKRGEKKGAGVLKAPNMYSKRQAHFFTDVRCIHRGHTAAVAGMASERTVTSEPCFHYCVRRRTE